MTPAIVENTEEKKREKYLMKKRCKMELHYTHFRCHLCFGGEVGKPGGEAMKLMMRQQIGCVMVTREPGHN